MNVDLRKQLTKNLTGPRQKDIGPKSAENILRRRLETGPVARVVITEGRKHAGRYGTVVGYRKDGYCRICRHTVRFVGECQQTVNGKTCGGTWRDRTASPWTVKLDESDEAPSIGKRRKSRKFAFPFSRLKLLKSRSASAPAWDGYKRTLKKESTTRSKFSKKASSPTRCYGRPFEAARDMETKAAASST